MVGRTKYFDGNEEVDLEAMAREELIRLQRQYRLMEGDRRGIAQQSGTTISRANRIMTVLRVEKENLLVDIGNADSYQNNKADRANQQVVADLLNQYDLYILEMKDKVMQIKEEEAQVDKITDRIVKQKLKMQTLYGQGTTLPERMKGVKVLEDRLYHVTTLFDSRCSKNNGLREAINLLLQERGHFHQRHLQLKRQIAVVKTKMLQNVYLATQTYDSRDDDVQKIKSIRERDEKESRQHVLEMKELQRILHHDEKNHMFLITKNIRRKNLEEDIDRQHRLESLKNRHMEKVIHSYKKSVKEILKIAGIQDVDKLCAAYNDQEQKNFVRFQYLADINNECEAILEAVHMLRSDIENESNECDNRQEQQIETIVQNRDDLLNMKLHLQRLYQTVDFATDKIQKVVVGVEDTFTVAECNHSPVIQLLGNYTGLHARNLKVCLEILEQKVRDLGREKATLEMRKEAEIDGVIHPHHYMPQTGHTTKVHAQGGPFKPKVILTGRLNPTEEDDEEDKALGKQPIYMDQIKKAIIERMTIAGIIGNNSGGDADSEHYASRISLLSRSGNSTTSKTANPSEDNERPSSTMLESHRASIRENRRPSIRDIRRPSVRDIRKASIHTESAPANNEGK